MGSRPRTLVAMPDHESPSVGFELALHLAKGVGPVLGRRLIDAFGSLDELRSSGPGRLERLHGVGRARARSLVGSVRDAAELVPAELERARGARAEILPRSSPRYPALLRQLPDAPLVLYVRGDLSEDAVRHACAIVGSRRATAYGLEQAGRFGSALARAGITVVSGGARGIDTAAHEAALAAGGRTVVVLGSGLARPYPPENVDLLGRIVAGGGAVVSEFPMETRPAPENFPRRNRIISGLSLGVVVIEAPTGSGALITARLANDHGREVLAVPGRVDATGSAGANALIRAGEASLATGPVDVIEALEPLARHVHAGVIAERLAPAPGAAERASGPAEVDRGEPPGSLTEAQRAVLEALVEPATIDALNRRTGLPPQVLRAEATILELRGLVRRSGSLLARADAR
jgi:DNA processing protein